MPYSITIAQPQHATLAVLDAAGDPVSELDAGAVAVVDAEADAGYVVQSLSVTAGGQAVEMDGSAFAMPESDVTVTATVVEEGGDVPPSPADKAALVSAIEAATNDGEETHVSADGEDVYTTDWWALQADVDALYAVVAAALKTADDDAATQADADAHEAAVEAAHAAFLAARSHGSLVPPEQVPDPAGEPATDGDPSNLYRWTQRFDGSLDEWLLPDGTWEDAPSSTVGGFGVANLAVLPFQEVGLAAGESYTLSWGEKAKRTPTVVSDGTVAESSTGVSEAADSNGFYRAWATFSMSSAGTWATVQLSSATQVRALKFEQGTAATDWTANPADVDTRDLDNTDPPDPDIVGPSDDTDVPSPDAAVPVDPDDLPIVPVPEIDPETEVVELSLEAMAAAAADNQHFWTRASAPTPDDGAGTGAFVTDEAQDTFLEAMAQDVQPTEARPLHNLLMNAEGILLRAAKRIRAAFLPSGVAFFDGEGNESSNIVAQFGKDGARIGKPGNSNIAMRDDEMVVTTVKNGTTQASFKAGAGASKFGTFGTRSTILTSDTGVFDVSSADTALIATPDYSGKSISGFCLTRDSHIGGRDVVAANFASISVNDAGEYSPSYVGLRRFGFVKTGSEEYSPCLFEETLSDGGSSFYASAGLSVDASKKYFGPFLTVGGSVHSTGNQNGTAVRFGAGGLTIVGGGGYSNSRYEAADLPDAQPDLYLGADETVFIEAGGATIEDRKTWTFDIDGHVMTPSGNMLSESNHTHDAADDITSGTLPIARGGTGATTAAAAWTALGGGAIGKKDALAASDIPNLPASKINSGTFDAARIPDLSGTYLPLAGGTLTGDLVTNRGNALTAQGTTIDVSMDDNGLPASTNLAGHVVRYLDANDVAFGFFQTLAYRTGQVQSRLFARKVVNGSNVNNGIELNVFKDGTRSVTLSDPAAWRTALGLDPQKTGANADSAWVSNATASNFFVAKSGNSAVLRIGGVKLAQALPHGSNKTVGTLPDGYQAFCPVNGVLFNLSSGVVGMVSVSGSNVIFRNTTGATIAANTELYGSVAYLTA